MFFGHDLIASAVEAGIDAAHVALALAEHEAAEHETWVMPSDKQRMRFVRELGSDNGSVQAVAVVAVSRKTLIDQLRESFGRPPCGLMFNGAVGCSAFLASVRATRAHEHRCGPNAAALTGLSKLST